MKTTKPYSTFSTANRQLRNLRISVLLLFATLFVFYQAKAGEITPISIYAPAFDVATISSFKLNGSAVRTNDNMLRLTSFSEGGTGSGFWNSRISLGTDKSFSAYFTFQIDGACIGGGDGMAFVIKSSTADLGDGGSGLGYAGISPSIAVEFDTWGELSGNHIAIVEDGKPYEMHTAYAIPSFTLRCGTVGHVWVDYNGVTDLFEVRLSTTTTRPAEVLVSATIDLATKFAGNNVFVGFTAGTGGATSNHYVQDFLFNNSYSISGLDPSGSYEQAASYPVTYHVTSDGAAVAIASIAVNGVTLTTDFSGDATISLAAGTYPFTVTKTVSTPVSGITTVIAAPVTENITLIVPPTITVSPSTINFGYVAPGTTSSEMSYTMSGIVLSPESGNITITPPANFEVSFTSGSGFSKSAITAAYSSGILDPLTVYVRFKPTGITSYSGSITHSGGTAATQEVNLAGSGITYCTPSASVEPCVYMNITNVTTTDGLTNFNNSSGCDASSYTDYSGSFSVSQVPGGWVNFGFTSFGYDFNYVGWIDFDDDGTFESSEIVVWLEYSSSDYYASTGFTVPSDAPLGSHRMRIRGEYMYNDMQGDPCAQLYYGETEDYTFIVEATSVAWTGSESTDWNNAANWNPAQVPTATNHVFISPQTNMPVVNQDPGSPAVCYNLTIEAGAVLTIGAGKALTVYNAITNNSGTTGLVVESGGSLIQNSGGVAATVKRVISDATDDKWHLFISPITSSIQASESSCFNGAYLDSYYEPTGEWTRLLTNGYVAPNTAYSLNYLTGSRTLSFPGTLTSSPHEYTDLSYTASAPGYGSGWNLVGNPYTCGINTALLAAPVSMNNAAYVWNGLSGNYSTITFGAASATPGTIASLQGFFVRTIEATNLLSLDNAAKAHGGTFVKSSKVMPDMLKLKITGNSYSDETFVRFLETATAGFDQQYDAYKLEGLYEAPQLYSILPDEKAAINTLTSYTADQYVPLGLKVGTTTNYTINVEGINSFDPSAPISLEDLKLGTSQDLRLNPEYSFTASPGDAENRFRLNFAAFTNVDETSRIGINVITRKGSVYITHDIPASGTVYLYSSSGQLLGKSVLNPGETVFQTSANAVYLVKIVTGKTSLTRKVIVVR